MTYTVFVDDLATYVSTSLEHAKELAEPYVGLGRSVAIRHYDDEAPPEAWRYDFGQYEWVAFDQSKPAIEQVATTVRLRRNAMRR
jgi:hypothetical protein